MTPTRSDPLAAGAVLRAVRSDVLRRPGLTGAALRDRLTTAYDTWLAGLLPPRDGIALAAVGGLGRREPAPHSDLDLVLLHDGRVEGLVNVADSIWYPIWDSGVGLDHSVRTPEQAVAVARTDLKAMLGLLDVRHVAGDAGLTGRLRAAVLDLWRAGATKRLSELRETAQARWARFGEAAFLLEPDLKESRGGLRDAQALRALAIAQLVDYPPRVRDVHPVLLDVRAEVQRAAGRADDVLRHEVQDDVAAALGLTETGTDEPRDVLLRQVNEAARVIAAALELAERRIAGGHTHRTGSGRRWPFAPARPTAERVGLARDVVAHDGEVALARDADPWSDPGLLLRVARAAAERDLPIAPFALERLAAESAPLPEPWPSGVLADFVAVLGAGRPAIAVLETLDDAGLLSRLLPEWDTVRCRAQHNPVHRFTVDRHLLETAAEAAAHDGGVARRDLLLLGALLHDIGKGCPGPDHSVTGAECAARVVQRIGLGRDDARIVVALVRHHLLLPNTATRRDPDDPVTIRIVRDATDDDVELLELLHVLAEADAAATGPGAWSEWKGALVAGLVARARAAMHGRPHPSTPALDADRRRLAERGELAVLMRSVGTATDGSTEILVAAPDRPGTLHRTAGVLALHSLDVHEASIATHAGMAVNRFVVEPRFGRVPDPALLRTELARALAGELDLPGRLAEKERSYARSAPRAAARDISVLWFDDSAHATVVEFRAADRIGLLSRITSALEHAGLDVRSARVSSTAGMAVDAFYVTCGDGRPVPASERAKLTGNLVAAVRADVVPAEPAEARPPRS